MLFGLVRGTILTSIGSLIGGVIAFLISRAFGSKGFYVSVVLVVLLFVVSYVLKKAFENKEQINKN
jgi:cation transporter-like permease